MKTVNETAVKHLKWMLVALVCVLLSAPVVSCSDDDDDDWYETTISESELPSSGRDFLTKYYPSEKVSGVVKDFDDGVVTYEVKLGNGHEVTFDSAGKWIAVDAPYGQTIPDAFIPESIKSYISANYADQGINEIEIENSRYKVELVGGLDLYFSLDGDFIYAE